MPRNEMRIIKGVSHGVKFSASEEKQGSTLKITHLTIHVMTLANCQHQKSAIKELGF